MIMMATGTDKLSEQNNKKNMHYEILPKWVQLINMTGFQIFQRNTLFSTRAAFHFI